MKQSLLIATAAIGLVACGNRNDSAEKRAADITTSTASSDAMDAESNAGATTTGVGVSGADARMF